MTLFRALCEGRVAATGPTGETCALFEHSIPLESFGDIPPERTALVLATIKGSPRVHADGSVGVEPFSMAETLADDRIGGRRLTVSNACGSGAQGVIEGIEMLADGDADQVLVVATDALTEFIRAGFGSLLATTANRASPFDCRRDGLMLGEASAAVLLRRAGGSSDEIARVVGWGCSNDANHISGPSRDGAGLALAIERALRGMDRAAIVAICAHGTATPYNDAMEARAFHTVFQGNPPPVFGIKGALGHTMGAAGLIEVIVSGLAATQGVIPPTAGFEQGDAEYVLDIVGPNPREVGPGLVLTVNSGFGGMNVALVLAPAGAEQ